LGKLAHVPLGVAWRSRRAIVSFRAFGCAKAALAIARITLRMVVARGAFGQYAEKPRHESLGALLVLLVRCLTGKHLAPFRAANIDAIGPRRTGNTARSFARAARLRFGIAQVRRALDVLNARLVDLGTACSHGAIAAHATRRPCTRTAKLGVHTRTARARAGACLGSTTTRHLQSKRHPRARAFRSLTIARFAGTSACFIAAATLLARAALAKIQIVAKLAITSISGAFWIRASKAVDALPVSVAITSGAGGAYRRWRVTRFFDAIRAFPDVVVRAFVVVGSAYTRTA